MYSENELLDKKPRELFAIVMELQNQLSEHKKLIEGLSRNQMNEELIVDIIKLICSDKSRIDKIRTLLSLISKNS